MFYSISILVVAGLGGLFTRHFLGATALGLLAVNVTGSFIAGYLGGLKQFDNPWVTAGIVGLCGCLTTFSGYALENVKLFEQGDFFKIASNIFLHNAMCLLMCYVGWSLAQKL